MAMYICPSSVSPKSWMVQMFGRRGRFLRVWVLSLALFGGATALHAQVQSFQPLRISSITITNTGPQNVSDALIRANIKVKEGDPYSRASVDADISNLYNT